VKLSAASIGRALLELAWAAGTVLASVWVARASSGEASTDQFAFTGTLLDSTGRPVTGNTALGFTFKGTGTSCSAQLSSVAADPTTGAFHAAIPLGKSCAEQLFQGEEVTLDITVDGTVAAENAPVTSVPFAKFADRTGVPDCPVGYQDQGAGLPICRRGGDEIVKVGAGSSAFWMDRYEASLWTEPFGGGSQVQPASGEYLDFPKNGQYTRVYYPASVRFVAPARQVTWFQANAACRAAGKRLPRSDEWLAAARGTSDPGNCNVQSPSVREAGPGTSCRSVWGAEDMIGNLSEWTVQWFAAIPAALVETPWSWPSGYNADTLNNGASSTRSGREGFIDGLPAAALHGGDHQSGARAGIFAFSLLDSPSSYSDSIGFRCVVDR
jgi:formylglycine-generating enzyme required for sulfatase activity